MPVLGRNLIRKKYSFWKKIPCDFNNLHSKENSWMNWLVCLQSNTNKDLTSLLKAIVEGLTKGMLLLSDWSCVLGALSGYDVVHLMTGAFRIRSSFNFLSALISAFKMLFFLSSATDANSCCVYSWRASHPVLEEFHCLWCIKPVPEDILWFFHARCCQICIAPFSPFDGNEGFVTSRLLLYEMLLMLLTLLFGYLLLKGGEI